jgi:heme/copper-type cytochrome/quinol oxidase subunit 3
MESTFSLGENCYGSSFFVTTGFHGLHVIIGTLFLSFCLKIIYFKTLNK